MSMRSCEIAVTLLIFVSLFSTPPAQVPGAGSPAAQGCDSTPSRAPDNDNSYSDATVLTNNSRVQGSLNGTNDRLDIYKVTLSATATMADRMWVNFTFTGQTETGYMVIENPEHYCVGEGLCAPGYIDSVNRTVCAASPGDYYIVLVCVSSGFSYNLSMSYSNIARTTDGDNTNATANTASDGGSYPGQLNSVYDHFDLYDLDVTSGTTTTEGVTVQLKYWQDKKLLVFSPDGTQRASSDIYMSSDPQMREQVKFAADQTGTYRILVGFSSFYAPPPPTTTYELSTTITPGVPVDDDYSRELARLVFDRTEIDSSFDSDFDEVDQYMIDLTGGDNLTVSIMYESEGWGPDITVWSEDYDLMNPVTVSNHNTGTYTWCDVDEGGRYYIELERCDFLGNYTILFSLTGDNLLFRDKPLGINDTDLDFSMPEDSVDSSHVDLGDVFFDPDSTLEFASPSHPGGAGENVNCTILPDGRVRFEPHRNFTGFEVFNFSATDIASNVLYWCVNVTVTPVNDAPVLRGVGAQTWRQGEEVNITLHVTDVDSPDLVFSDNSSLFEVGEGVPAIRFTPSNADVGVHQIGLEVSDGEFTDTINFTAVIENTNDEPAFSKVGGEDAVPGGTVLLEATEDRWNNFTVEVCDPDLEIGAMEAFHFSTNVTDPQFNVEGETGTISFFPAQEHVGTFFASITVFDGDDGSCLQNISFDVANVNDPPTAPVISLQSRAGPNVTCLASGARDEDGDELTYTWDFGDGSNPATGTEVNHTYGRTGNYTITLAVSDGNGGESFSSLDVSIDNLSSGEEDEGVEGDGGGGEAGGGEAGGDADGEDETDGADGEAPGGGGDVDDGKVGDDGENLIIAAIAVASVVGVVLAVVLMANLRRSMRVSDGGRGSAGVGTAPGGVGTVPGDAGTISPSGETMHQKQMYADSGQEVATDNFGFAQPSLSPPVAQARLSGPHVAAGPAGPPSRGEMTSQGGMPSEGGSPAQVGSFADEKPCIQPQGFEQTQGEGPRQGPF